MIIAGFTGQLKGWWDNYLNQDQRDKVLLAVKQEGDNVTQNAVYTLVLNIIGGDSPSINYDNFTYGKLISACIKQHRLNERKQLGEFCEQFAFDVPKQKSKEKDYTPRKKHLQKKITKNGRKRELRRNLEELKKEKETLPRERKSIANSILATNVGYLSIMPKIVESRKRLRAST
ncbi:hypothetical protein H5410_061460 [Solanum commersonii]|uniref:DUF7746 domain-containing protein n=1 Tax=Solanum commersonii TaxID=4109 RepID=A0A9J5W9Q8_SOLCO|nr:hypothetical protein H5410_061460 [Solanum commersonii]